MELSIEVKGYIQDVLATKVYAWDKIKTFGKRVGVDTTDIDKKLSKRKACEYIIENVPKDRGEEVIKTLLEMAKRGLWDKDYSEEILTEINQVVERTMSCRVDRNGQVIPLFPWLKEEPDLILKKLGSLGFAKGSTNYRDAVKTYRASPKGSLGLLRTAVEALVEDVLKSKKIAQIGNQKENFRKLEQLGVLMEIPDSECQKCHHKKRDHELNYSYAIYGLLSHYGSHKELVTEELANFLFTSTSAFIWLLINRYETQLSSP